MQCLLLQRPVVIFFTCTLLASSWVPGRIGSAAESDTTSALKAALTKNVGHARQWLDERDYKSLAQSTGGLALLAELLKAKSDDAAWQAAVGNVLARASELQAAARGEEDLARCQAALKALEAAAAAVEKITPTGQPLALPKGPGIRLLMLTLDGVQADAKIALLTGHVATAKKQAIVLAELSRLLSNARSTEGSNARSTEKWSSLADDFSKVTLAAATSAETDAKAVRPLFRAIAERCEACHENSRTR
jgi:cytochrome c556